MPIWMLLLFAACMVAAVIGFGAGSEWAPIALPVFAATLTVFLAALVIRGVRRPVV